MQPDPNANTEKALDGFFHFVLNDRRLSDADLRKLFDRLDTDHSAPPTARVRAAPGGGAG